MVRFVFVLVGLAAAGLPFADMGPRSREGDAASYFSAFQADLRRSELDVRYSGKTASAEPASCAILAVGGLAILRRRRASQ